MKKLDNISQAVINKSQEREQALNGWIAASSAQSLVTGQFSGIKVMAGETASITLVFDDSRCVTNSLSIDLVEGDYLPTPGLISATVTAGKVFLIKDQIF